MPFFMWWVDHLDKIPEDMERVVTSHCDDSPISDGEFETLWSRLDGIEGRFDSAALAERLMCMAFLSTEDSQSRFGKKIQDRLRERSAGVWSRRHRTKDLPAGLRSFFQEFKVKRPNLRGARAARLAVIDFLGNTCSLCGFDDILALQIDHPKQDGKYERGASETPKLHYQQILEAVMNGSDRYRVLCSNCNTITAIASQRGSTVNVSTMESHILERVRRIGR